MTDAYASVIYVRQTDALRTLYWLDATRTVMGIFQFSLTDECLSQTDIKMVFDAVASVVLYHVLTYSVSSI